MKLLTVIFGIVGLAGSAMASGTDGSGLVVLDLTADGALTGVREIRHRLVPRQRTPPVAQHH